MAKFYSAGPDKGDAGLQDKLVVGHDGIVGLDGQWHTGGEQAEQFGLGDIDHRIHHGSGIEGSGLVEFDAFARLNGDNGLETGGDNTGDGGVDCSGKHETDWGLGFCVIEDPTQMTANRHLSPGTFGHGGAHGTQVWADPATGLIHVFMIQRANLVPHPDDSPMRRAYQDAVAAC